MDLATKLAGLTRGEEALEEERRLAYVAITRARERLLLFHAGHRTLFGQLRYGRPSRFLVDLPRDDVKLSLPGAGDSAQRTGGYGGYGGYGGARAARDDDDGPSPAFRHPMASAGPKVTTPVREPGERYVERDDDACDLRRGDRVRHKRFGVGRVLEVEEGAEPKIVAEFSGFGEMTILRRFLEPVA